MFREWLRKLGWLQPNQRKLLSRRGWPRTVDVERLDAAFEKLGNQGIVAVHNGPCCDTCTGAYLWSKAVPAAKKAGRSAIGYVFYNEQTSESVAEGEDLVLVCGAIPEPDDESQAQAKRIASLVQRELLAAGLHPKSSSPQYIVRVPIALGNETVCG